MPGLYSRVTARGYPSQVIAGMTGAGSLESQGYPQDLAAHGAAGDGSPGYTTQVLPQFGPDTPAELGIPVGMGFWGLAGEANPDQTIATVPAPRPDGSWSQGDHAAPVPGWSGHPDFVPPGQTAEALDAMHQESTAIHAVNFGSIDAHTKVSTDTSQPWDAWYSNDPGQNVAQTVTGQLRNMAGFDGTQGYGGGGDGPGGINDYGLGAPHVDRGQWAQPQPQPYLDPAERAFVAPQGSPSFIPSDAVASDYAGTYWNSDGTIYSDPTAYQPPPDPGVQSAPQAAASVSAGWWS